MKKKVDHYEIIYENEKRVRYSVFKSSNLDVIGKVYGRMLQFEDMFQTFPNASCRLELAKDYNYDPDLGSFNIADVIHDQIWQIVVEDVMKKYGNDIESVISYKEEE